MARRNRYVDAGIAAGRTTVAAGAKAGRVFWLQTTGLIFAGFGVAGIAALARDYPAASHGRIALIGAVTAIFLYFAVTSFWRARKAGSQ
jgi:hypothetical protein